MIEHVEPLGQCQDVGPNGAQVNLEVGLVLVIDDSNVAGLARENHSPKVFTPIDAILAGLHEVLAGHIR